MIIAALDPGETTGYVIYDTDTGREIACGEIFGNFRRCVDYILWFKPKLFIVEDFRVRPGKGAGLSKLARLWPVEWLGVLRYMEVKLLVQTPAQAKWLKRVTGASAHEADARRHLQVWLNKQGKDHKAKLKEAIKRELANEG